MTVSEQTTLSSPAPFGVAGRLWASGVAAFWIVAFGWMWLGAPVSGRVLGAAWAALGLFWPTGWFASLAWLALPAFGNGPGGAPYLYLFEMGLMGFVIRSLTLRAAGRAQRRAHPLDFWVALFVAWAWVCTIPSWPWLVCELRFARSHFLHTVYQHYATANVFTLQAALKVTLGAAFYGALRDGAWTPQRIRRGFVWLVAGATATAGVGLLNYFGCLPLAWWRGENPDILRFGYRRLQSFYGHSGWLAQYLAALAPAAVMLAWGGRRRAWGVWGVVLVLAVAQLLTFQRAGWLGFAAGVVVAMALLATGERVRGVRFAHVCRRLGLGAAALVGLAFVLALTNEALRHRLGELTAYEHRIHIWHSALSIWRFQPWFGLGLGRYYQNHVAFFGPDHPFWHLDKVTAHSLYLHIGAERGIIGLAIFLTLIGVALRGVWGAMRQRERRGVAVALIGAWAALLVDGLFQYIFYVRVVGMLFWLILGWGVALSLGEDREERGARLRPCRSRVRTVLACALIVVSSGCLGWLCRDWLTDCARGVSRLDIQGETFHATGADARVAPPPDARGVSLALHSVDPSMTREPLVFTISQDRRVLAEVALTSPGQVYEARLDLSDSPDPAAPLHIHASRTWPAWAWGIRYYRLLDVGVTHGEPRALDVNPTP